MIFANGHHSKVNEVEFNTNCVCVCAYEGKRAMRDHWKHHDNIWLCFFFFADAQRWLLSAQTFYLFVYIYSDRA